MRLFPEAKFVHVIRDGRDASASRVSQTRGRSYPRTRMQGLRWFEKRLRRIEEGARQIPEEKLLQVSLEDILRPPRHEEARAVARFVGVRFSRKMRRFFYGKMDLSQANAVRWKQGLSERAAEADREALRRDARGPGARRDQLGAVPARDVRGAA